MIAIKPVITTITIVCHWEKVIMSSFNPFKIAQYETLVKLQAFQLCSNISKATLKKSVSPVEWPGDLFALTGTSLFF